MSGIFSSPKIPAPPPIPPAPPAPPFRPAEAVSTSESEVTKEKAKRRKGISSTILTSPTGLTVDEMNVTKPSLLGGKV